MIIRNKDPQKDFIVLCINDINMTPEEWAEGTKTNYDLLRTTKELFDRTHPDLVVLTGDIAYGGEMDCFKKVAELLESYHTPWTFIFGNHDQEKGPEVANAEADLLMQYPHCIFEKGDPKLGIGNFVIRIDEKNEPIYSLIMMDSHTDEFLKSDFGETCLAQGRIHANQLEWYKDTVSALPVKNTLIMHIPFPVYTRVFEAAWNYDYSPKRVDPRVSGDPKYWNPGYEGSFGVQRERVFAYPIEFGELKLLKSLGKTELVLAAHDHINNFVIPFQGITFAYVLKTGSGCYCNEDMNGGDVIRINRSGAKFEHIYVD